MSAPVQSLQPPSIDTVDLVERLRRPLWVHSDAPFGSPQLEKETTEIDLAQAADVICQYRSDSRRDEDLIATLKARVEQAERAVDVLETALRIFVPPRNGPMEDALWGNQPDDAVMTIRIKFGEYKKGRAALESKP